MTQQPESRPEPPFVPNQPMNMDWQFVLIDARTRERPFGVLVDSIACDRNDKPSAKRAERSVDNAISCFNDAIREPANASIHIPYGVLHCSFALWAMELRPPVTIIPAPGNCEQAIGLLKAQTPRGIIEAMMTLGTLFASSDYLDAGLSEWRGWAWSSHLAGLIVYVDQSREVPQSRPERR